MVNEKINLYTNISGKTQSVYADWSNATDVPDDGTINLYESIGDDLVDAGLFTLTTENYATAVSERDPSEVDTAIDALEDAIGTETDVDDLRDDLNDVIVSLIVDEGNITDVIVSLIADEGDIDALEAIVTTNGIGESLINFGTNSTQVGGKDILYDGGDGNVYRILLTDGTLSVEQVS